MLVYFDNGATSWPKPESVYRAMDDYMRNVGASPGRSGHKLSLCAGRILYETREAVAKLFGVSNSSRIIFTLNATEALNLGIKGLLSPGDHVITTSMEHNSVIRPLRVLEKEIDIGLTRIKCSKDGEIDLNRLREAVKEETRLIVVVHASNVTGTIMPVAQIGQIAKEHNLTFMIDAAQTAGVLPIDVDEIGVDLLAFTGHKGMLGPQGTGGLYIKEGVNLRELIQGGTGSKSELETQPEILPDKFESGTHNTVGLAGLGAGVKFILEEGIEKIREKEEELTAYLLDKLSPIEGVEIYGSLSAKDKTAVVSFNIKDVSPSDVGYLLSERFGVMSRIGLHCAPLAHRTIGTFPYGTVRLSLGYFNSIKEIDYVSSCLKEIAKEKR
ncbi:aminotransferase class V-fold PLP-dependent enzyme [bacterium]|nr:aminotransferase class V-fold PLP-dependent enzyme [bacterium]MBU1614418.1 aminotransferase class V-fold PLP-dependent enzyme [bacterium]